MTLTLNKIKITRLAIFLLLFFAFFLGFNNGNVFADSQDIIYTISDPVADVYICDNSLTNVQAKCSDYSYIGWSVSGNTTSIQFSISGTNLRFPATSGYFAISGRNPIAVTKSLFPTGVTVTVTLSATAPGGTVPEGSTTITENGTYDVSQYASVNVNVPTNVTEIIEDPISNDFQKVFFEIVKNIIPAFGILLVVWFGIDILSSLIFGRGR